MLGPRRNAGEDERVRDLIRRAKAGDPGAVDELVAELAGGSPARVPAPSGPIRGERAVLAYERAIAVLILSSVVEATPQIGRPPSRAFLANVLAGSLRGDVVAADAHRLATFGALAHFGAQAIFEFVDTLVRDGLLQQMMGRRGLVLTATGRALVESAPGAPEGPLGLIRGVVDVTDLDLAVRSGLVEGLRRYRAERAGASNVPEARVFSDATMREVATQIPLTTMALEMLGLSDRSIREIGDDLLRIVNEHLPIIERLRARLEDRP